MGAVFRGFRPDPGPDLPAGRQVASRVNAPGLRPRGTRRDARMSLAAGKETSVAYLINDECVSCGTCEPECPVSAISQGDDKYVIDAAKCTDCGACAEVCPVECIKPAS